MVTDLGKRIDAVVDAAMQTGDWTLFDAYRAIFAEDPKHPVNAALLERMDIGREAASFAPIGQHALEFFLGDRG